jgi:hypothetical protein
MAEIKSAIELAMERTKNLVMSDEEKKEFARKDAEDKLKAVVRRFQEGMIDAAAFARDYNEIDGTDAYKRGIIVDIVVQEFESTTERERLFSLLELLGERRGPELAEEVRLLRMWFEKELKFREGDIREKILSRLADIGISGSAVRPNLAEWEESQDAAREIGVSIRDRINAWKRKLVAATP